MVLLLLAAAFFAAAEIAFLATGPLRARKLAHEGGRQDRWVARLLRHPSMLLSTILVGITASLYFLEVISAYTFERTWRPYGEFLSFPLTVVLVLLFAEVTPAVIAAQNPIGLARWAAGPVLLVAWVLWPLTWTMNRITRALSRLFGVRTSESPRITEEDLKAMIRVSQRQGFLEEDERRMLFGVFRLSDRTAKEICVPRQDMVTAPVDARVGEVADLMAASLHSRVPLVEPDTDQVLALASSKDLLPLLEGGLTTASVHPAHSRPVLYVPESENVEDLLRDLQQHRSEFAIVVDEAGATQGLVTMEDVLEELVGEIYDEHDREHPEVISLGPGEYLVDGALTVGDLNEHLGLALPSEGFDTVGGMVYSLAGRVPHQGEVFAHDNVRLRVEKMERRRVREVRVTVLPAQAEGET